MSKKINHREIELIVYDFDGVMTDNKVYTFSNGKEAVICNRADGLAVGIIKKLGIPQLILSTEVNPVVSKRAEKIGIPVLYGVKNKKAALVKFCNKKRLRLEKTIFIGNDLNDLDVIGAAGISICPADAHREVRERVDIRLRKKGGEGVIMEFLDFLRHE